MKILIVDDEPPARERLRRQLTELPDCETIDEAASGEEAIRLCEAHQPDVVLMDIRMPGIGGLEAARRIAAMAEAPAVIFTTAFDQYALDAYSAGPADYLMKPVRSAQLARALDRARRPTRALLASLTPEQTDRVRVVRPGAASAADRSRATIAARTGTRVLRIPVGRILAFCADNKYTRVVHEDGDVLIDESLKSLEQEFARAFVRVHREALVSLDHVLSLERDEAGHACVRLVGERERSLTVRVSRRHLATVRRRLAGT